MQKNSCATEKTSDFHLLRDMNQSGFSFSQLTSALTFQLLQPQNRSGGLQGWCVGLAIFRDYCCKVISSLPEGRGRARFLSNLKGGITAVNTVRLHLYNNVQYSDEEDVLTTLQISITGKDLMSEMTADVTLWPEWFNTSLSIYYHSRMTMRDTLDGYLEWKINQYNFLKWSWTQVTERRV